MVSILDDILVVLYTAYVMIREILNNDNLLHQLYCFCTILYTIIKVLFYIDKQSVQGEQLARILVYNLVIWVLLCSCVFISRMLGMSTDTKHSK